MRLQLNIYAYTNQKVTTNVREGRRKKGIDMFTKNKIEHESTREDSSTIKVVLISSDLTKLNISRSPMILPRIHQLTIITRTDKTFSMQEMTHSHR